MYRRNQFISDYYGRNSYFLNSPLRFSLHSPPWNWKNKKYKLSSTHVQHHTSHTHTTKQFFERIKSAVLSTSNVLILYYTHKSVVLIDVGYLLVVCGKVSGYLHSLWLQLLPLFTYTFTFWFTISYNRSLRCRNPYCIAAPRIYIVSWLGFYCDRCLVLETWIKVIIYFL